jgi:DNA-binding IscR family transcriptional regulator
VRNVSLIYGGFGLALLFMVSIQLAWWIVLLGNEATYCLQNFEFMARSRRDAAAFEGSWVALAALVYVTYSFRHGEPIIPHEKLAERLQLETAELGRVLEPLIENGVLCETGGDAEGYLLRVDPHELPVGRVFEIYEPLQPEILAPLPAPLTDELDKLRHRLAQARHRETEGLTLAQLASG